jgi:hypothetical protein
MNTPYEFAAEYRPRTASGRGNHLIFLILCAFPLVVSLFMSTNGVQNSVHLFGLTIPIEIPCLIKLFTGFNCPACGMTRSFIYLSHLNLPASFAMNHAGPLLYLLCLFELPYRLTLFLRGRVPLRRVLRVAEISLITVFSAVDLFFFLRQFIVLL